MANVAEPELNEPTVSLPTLIKINFLSGSIGSLLVAPVIYVVELGVGSFGDRPTWSWPLGLFTWFMGSLITGVAFTLLGLVAFPVLRAACNRKWISL